MDLPALGISGAFGFDFQNGLERGDLPWSNELSWQLQGAWQCWDLSWQGWEDELVGCGVCRSLKQQKDRERVCGRSGARNKTSRSFLLSTVNYKLAFFFPFPFPEQCYSFNSKVNSGPRYSKVWENKLSWLLGSLPVRGLIKLIYLPGSQQQPL